ncbi:hypothetical protein AB0K05_44255, partial [Nonomuraea sp. NPDC049486]|uniref:hypothetical protein n=1 Tax=Nonomuraea sp. NPDC049486 TaxID=3155773 RepID=UPI00343AB474
APAESATSPARHLSSPVSSTTTCRQFAEITSERIPKSLQVFRDSDDANLIREARSTLEHAIALNHLLFEGAYHIIPLLIELLHVRASKIRAVIYDLLVEIAQSEAQDESVQILDEARRLVALDTACRARLLQALPFAWHDLASDNEDTIFGAMDLIGFVDPDKNRFVEYLRNPIKPFTEKCRHNADEWIAELG